MSETAKDLVLISNQDVIDTRKRSEVLKEYIRSELREGVDYGYTFAGAKQPSLYKAGAEKLARLFRLGSRVVDRDKILDADKNFAYFAYTVEIYHLDTGIALSQCEGSANSQEKKYRAHPVSELLNTLQKMAQKRAFVGGIISAIGASEFYTQDVEDMPPETISAPGKANQTKVVGPATTATQANRPSNTIARISETLGSHTTPKNVVASYVIPFGQLSGKRLSEVSVMELRKSLAYWQAIELKEKKPLQGKAKQFVEAVSAYLKEE